MLAAPAIVVFLWRPVSLPAPPSPPQVTFLPPQVLQPYARPPGPSYSHDVRRSEQDDDNPFCAMPKLKEGQKVVLLGSYEGAALADLTLTGGGQTYVGDVTVEPGAEPLYVVLTSYSPMIWKFSGAVDRVSKVVATALVRSQNSGLGIGGAGIIGLPKDKVEFLGSSKCLSYFLEQGLTDAAQNHILHIRHSSFVASFKLHRFTIPASMGC